MLKLTDINKTGYRAIKCGNSNRNVAIIRRIKRSSVNGCVVGIKREESCLAGCKSAAKELRKWVREHKFSSLKSSSNPVRRELMRSFGPKGEWEPTYSSYSFYVSAKKSAEVEFLNFIEKEL